MRGQIVGLEEHDRRLLLEPANRIVWAGGHDERLAVYNLLKGRREQRSREQSCTNGFAARRIK